MKCNSLGGMAATECWDNASNNLKTYGEFAHTQQQRLGSWYFLTLAVSFVGMFLNTCIIYDLKLVI
jgi:hypothetical protein